MTQGIKKVSMPKESKLTKARLEAALAVLEKHGLDRGDAKKRVIAKHPEWYQLPAYDNLHNIIYLRNANTQVTDIIEEYAKELEQKNNNNG